MDKPIKIDFLTSSMEAGGAQRVISILADHLVQRGYSIRIITFEGPDHYNLNPKIKRLKLHKQRIVKSVIVNGFFNLMAYYRKKSNRPDIISSHLDLLGFISIPNGILYKIKVVVSEHNNHLAYNNKAQKFLWDYLYPKANIVTILTEFDKNFFLQKNKNTIIVPNPSPFEKIKNSKGNKTINKEIVAIGNLDRYKHKGFDNLLQIVKTVFETNPEWRLKIIGEGKSGLSFLKEEIQKLNIQDKVEFTGYVNNVDEILSNAEIFILSSRFEGLPMVLLEAMSQGTACISYDCITGPSEIITHNHNGILVENQNIQAMITNLKELIENRELRSKIKSNAPDALDKFSIQVVGKQWEGIFKKLMSS
ncbi:glycosyltransferase family 4 protein [Maribacter sp. MJ134]|uniref:glycosyltransferase family 4 protein n=1 Tax=Maribacter sp. MJ134 TaxID=2496865 RepID=UPI000F820B8B|nr:glycosyltransferase family 4 protein [Maribacter sp. MJ134]AZQ58469.1 glycosyltransferase family 4 protein [Maribacter sp. MJ134]